MGRCSAHGRHAGGRGLSKVSARSHPARGRSDAVLEMTNYFDLLRLAAPETVLVVTALVVLALGLWTARAARLCSGVAAAGLLFASSAVLMLPEQASLFSGMLVVTPLISLFKVICIALAFFTVILARQLNTPHHGEYLALLLLATVGLMLLVGSEELLVIFIGLELTGLSLYVMAAFDKTDVRSAEAGLKYFLFGSTASAFTLFGISLVYGMTATTSLAAIAQKLGTMSPLLAAGLVMTLIRCALWWPAAAMDLAPPFSPQRSMHLLSSARSESSLSSGAKLVATTSPISPDYASARPGSQDAWPSSCCHLPASRRSRGSSGSSISLVRRFTLPRI